MIHIHYTTITTTRFLNLKLYNNQISVFALMCDGYRIGLSFSHNLILNSKLVRLDNQL